MIAMKFSGLMDTAEIRADHLVVRGAEIYLDEEPTAIAEHRDSHWQVGSQHFSRFDISGPVAVTLISGSEAGAKRIFLEPSIWFADGVLHSPTGHIVCLNAATNMWFDIPSGTRCTAMVIAAS